MRNLKCFVIMPFHKTFKPVYTSIRAAAARQVINNVKVAIHRLDDDQRPVWLDEALKQSLGSADFCIADLTGNNTNVMWEVGYAMGIGKAVIALTQDLTTLPSDLRLYRTIQYDRKNLTRMTSDSRASLKDTVPQILAEGDVMPHVSDDLSLLRYLRKTVSASDERALIGKFKKNGGMLARFFLASYRDQYKYALLRQ